MVAAVLMVATEYLRRVANLWMTEDDGGEQNMLQAIVSKYI